MSPSRELTHLRSTVDGSILVPDDPGYEEARRVFNWMIDRRPALIVRCRSERDAVAAVRFARSHDLLLSIKGGGHNVAGHATCDGGMMIDFSLMRDVAIDSASRTATVAAGATWAEFDRAGEAARLIVPGGTISDTGVAGFTLGGGIGYFSRKWGLACDSLAKARLVTAAGNLIDVDADGHPDLLWALRGGGGNFGLVTRFEFDVHPLPAVFGGMLAYPLAAATTVLEQFAALVETAPDEFGAVAALLSLPGDLRMISLLTAYAGDAEAGSRVVAPLRAAMPPLMDQLQTTPYTALQSLVDFTAPQRTQVRTKALFLESLPRAAIDVIVDYSQRFTSPLSQVHIHMLGGEMSRRSPASAAFAHREARFVVNLVGTWEDAADAARHEGWLNDFWRDLNSTVKGSAYLNFLGEEGEDRIRSAYGTNYDRLVEIKTRYDPDNLFRVNQNIKPGPTSRT